MKAPMRSWLISWTGASKKGINCDVQEPKTPANPLDGKVLMERIAHFLPPVFTCILHLPDAIPSRLKNSHFTKKESCFLTHSLQDKVNLRHSQAV